MKKEFAANVRKARTAAGKALKGNEVGDSTAASKKRKWSGEDSEETNAAGKKTRVTMKIGDVEVSIDHDSVETVSKERKQQQSTPVKAANRQSPTKQTASTQSPSMQPPSRAEGPTPQTPQQTPQKPPPPTPKTNPNPKIKKETPTTPKTPTKKTPQIKREAPQTPNTPNTSSPHNITGTYTISSPQLPQTLHLHLTHDPTSVKTWGTFNLPPKSGILLIADPYPGPNVPISFGWRARDSESGRLSLGRGCFGEVLFSGWGQVRGMFFNLFPKPMEFEGERSVGTGWGGVSADVEVLKREWGEFVREAYGR